MVKILFLFLKKVTAFPTKSLPALNNNNSTMVNNNNNVNNNNGVNKNLNLNSGGGVEGNGYCTIKVGYFRILITEYI